MTKIVRLLVTLVAALLGVAPTTTGTAERFTYDVPVMLRAGAEPVGAIDSGAAQRSVTLERSTSAAVERKGTSTTPAAGSVATNTASLADDAAGSYGPFHRLESPTQTPATAALQEANEEMWGATARGGLNPTVKAYQGPLPPGARGVEFTTPVRPSDVGLGRPGDIAIWRRGSPGVVDVDDDFVKIACTVVRNKQC